MATDSRNGTPIGPSTDPAARTLPMLLADTVATRGTAPAVADEHHTFSYDDLARRARDGASCLANAGVGHGDRVGVLLPNSVGFVEAFFATLAVGAAVVPIGSGAQRAEIDRTLGDAGATALITASDDTPAACDLARFGIGRDGLHAIRPARVSHAPRPPAPGDAAVVAYSFTTSPPLPVVRTHENLSVEAESFWTVAGLAADDVCLGAVPLSHAHGLGNALLASIRGGSRLVLRPRFLRRHTLDTLVDEGVTVFPTVPFMARMLETTDRRRHWDLGAVRLCISAGAPLTRDVYDAFLTRFGVPLRQLYGLTAAGDVTANLGPLAELDPESVGRPLPGVAVTLEDRHGKEVAAGEIVVRSAAAAGGVERPLRTGDRGHWSSRRELVITGRTSAFVNAAGNKVDPLEVEAALRAHPAVADAVVIGVPAGHGEETVTAFVVPRGPCSEQSLRVYCCGRLATYKIPRLFRFRRALPSRLSRDDLVDELRSAV